MLISANINERARLGSLIDSWYWREPVIARTTLCVLALVPLLLMVAYIDERTMNGVNIWVKPLKFNISIVMYLGTLTWFAGWVDGSLTKRLSYRIYVLVLCGTLLFMLPWLYGAAIIGEPAHFNRDHPILAPLYSLMGIVSVLFTTGAMVFAVLIAINRRSPLTIYFRYSVVCSLAISFIFTVFMAGELASMDSHWIGGTESDKNGLWLFGWSRDGGDLRVAHFYSLHAMQFIPLIALIRLPQCFRAIPRLSAIIVSLLYCGFLLHVYFQAKSGTPFMSWLG